MGGAFRLLHLVQVGWVSVSAVRGIDQIFLRKVNDIPLYPVIRVANLVTVFDQEVNQRLRVVTMIDQGVEGLRVSPFLWIGGQKLPAASQSGKENEEPEGPGEGPAPLFVNTTETRPPPPDP